jgi:hypothetical protein
MAETLVLIRGCMGALHWVCWPNSLLMYSQVKNCVIAPPYWGIRDYARPDCLGSIPLDAITRGVGRPVPVCSLDQISV